MSPAEENPAVALFSKPHPQASAVLHRVVNVLRRRGIEVVADDTSARALGIDAAATRKEAAKRARLLVSVGGDGTLLAAARAVGDGEIPILGINLGHLGFLTETTCEDLDHVLDLALSGRAPVEARHLLQVRKDGRQAEEGDVALNDVVISKRDIARLFRLSLFVDDEWVTDYRADGLIVSTPTGSTAYNLAAGGPLVYPGVDALVITPICPHSLSQRPIIVPGTAKITVKLADGERTSDVQMTLDGQLGVPLEPGERVEIRRAPYSVRLVRSPGKTFFAVMREKLGWGGRP